MSKQVVCAIRDRAVDAFLRPMFAPAVGACERSFMDEINRADANNPMYKHPEDYDLYMMGHYDESTGMFETGVPKMLRVGKECVKSGA